MNARVNIDSFSQSIKGVKSNFMEKEATVTSYGQKPHMSEIGRISVGELVTREGQNGSYTAPAGLDYFRFRTIHKTVMAKVSEVYGHQPNSLPIFFNTDDPAAHCIESLTLRDKAGKKVAYGDGMEFMVWNAKRGIYEPRSVEKNPTLAADILEYVRKGAANDRQREAIDWKHEFTLRFCIKDVPALGYWQFQTGAAKTSLLNLRSTMDQCMEVFKQIAFLPFLLTVKMAESNNPGFARKYPVVEIIPQFSFERGLQLAQYIEQNPGFRVANLALMNVNAGGSIPELMEANGLNVKLLNQ